MKREIKFRGKLLQNNDSFKTYKKGVVITGGFCNQGDKAFIVAHFNVFEVDPESVQQFTGLQDKNGTDIYEGDIIDHFAFYGYVIFENGMFSMNSNAKKQFCNCRQPLAYHDVQYMNIVGNIHQNPELL